MRSVATDWSNVSKGIKRSAIAIAVVLATVAIYWIVRTIVYASIYASGLVWVLSVVVCAPLWFRVFISADALERHVRYARKALYAGVLPLVSYAIAWRFDMTSDQFPWVPVELGTVLLVSAATSILAGGASWFIGALVHPRLKDRRPAHGSGHGVGLIALIPSLPSRWYWNYSLDILLAASATAGLFIGRAGTLGGGLLAGMLIYTWYCDYVYRVVINPRPESVPKDHTTPRGRTASASQPPQEPLPRPDSVTDLPPLEPGNAPRPRPYFPAGGASV